MWSLILEHFLYFNLFYAGYCLLNQLEKYSSNLEAIVAERTKELMVEKAKTEQLVSQMLPKKVVEDLKHGRTVEPESFECVTIFFR